MRRERERGGKKERERTAVLSNVKLLRSLNHCNRISEIKEEPSLDVEEYFHRYRKEICRSINICGSP
jgi:hypothetical protein